MRAFGAITLFAVISFSALSGATQTIAAIFQYQPALGAPLVRTSSGAFYWPWAVLAWQAHWRTLYPRPFALTDFILASGIGAAMLTATAAVGKSAPRYRGHGLGGWGRFEDARDAGLFASTGAILGKLDGEILAFDGPGHQILIGASRAGKGRGHVVPTLLSWNGSALVLDVKGELDHGDPRHGFPGTSGYRAQLGPVLRFAPTDPNSNCFNVLFSVRRGANEVRDVQNIVDIMVEPKGETRGSEQFWNNSAKIVVTGAILHVLYAEPVERKTLAVVREKLRDLDHTAEEMRRTLHRLNTASNAPEVHPEILHAAESYLAGEERLRSGIKATAESVFGIFADPIVAEKTSHSDFRLGDLMCASRPVTLYLQPPPSDTQRLMPLMRLFIAQVARALMEDQTHDGEGRPKQHKLLLLLDEFPQLGRIDFFEKMMGAMAGYGLKAYLVCQSLNHLIRAYGRDNVILDNCALVTTFAAADPETAKHIAAMAGEVWEIRPQESEHRPRALLGPRKGAITYREDRRPLLLPADVRSLRPDEELIFVAGAKPIRAKKLRFDTEPVFAKRLFPTAPPNPGLSPAHDWVDVRALGLLPAEKKTMSALRTARNRTERPKEAATPQSDLFPAEASQPPSPLPPPPSPPGPTISELALAGFRQSATKTPPEDVDEASPPRRAPGTGV